MKAFLASRGATVTYLELYQRVPLEAPDTDTLSQWSIRPFDAALASSVSVFDATLDALGDQAAGILGSSTIVCPSQRVAEHCQSRVSNSILVATGPSDEETAQELGKIARQR